MTELINEIKVPPKEIEQQPVHLTPFINTGFVRMLVTESGESGKTYWTLCKLLPNLSPISHLYLICKSGFNCPIYQNAIKYFKERN